MDILNAAKQGGINLHGSILPKYRGAAPIQRCIEQGDKLTGVTLMQMAKGMDTGDIIAIETIPIDPDETAGELFMRLSFIAGDMAKSWLPRICLGEYTTVPQDENAATYAKKVEESEARLDIHKNSASQYNRFRAFTPSPGAFLDSKYGYLKVTKARLSAEKDVAPGLISLQSSCLTLGFKDGAIELREVQPEGKKRMSGMDFANGARLRPGDSFLL